MTWVRGIVVCADGIAKAVAKQLDAQSRYCRLGSVCGETGFAFAGRDIPEFTDLGDDGDRVCIAGSWDGTSEFTWNSGSFGFPESLVPKLMLTVGISIDDARVVESSAFLRSLLKTIGKPDEEGSSQDHRVDYRWDTEAPFGDPKHGVICKTLESLGKQLEKAGAGYRAAFFKYGFGTVDGDLDEGDEVWAGPSACVSLEWQDNKGKHSVTATNAEFTVDWDGAPESDVWNEPD